MSTVLRIAAVSFALTLVAGRALAEEQWGAPIPEGAPAVQAPQAPGSGAARAPAEPQRAPGEAGQAAEPWTDGGAAVAGTVPPGRWIQTDPYGWVWMPDSSAYVQATPSSVAYAYVYGPAFGWSWVAAPWVGVTWGWPYYGYGGLYVGLGFGWYGYPGPYWYGGPYRHGGPYWYGHYGYGHAAHWYGHGYPYPYYGGRWGGHWAHGGAWYGRPYGTMPAPPRAIAGPRPVAAPPSYGRAGAWGGRHR